MILGLLVATEFKVFLGDMKMSHYQSEVRFFIGKHKDFVIC